MSSSPGRRGSGVRPEIQALRAAAVLLVVLFHLWPGRLPGGYVGVDAFFVISGYLITTHLLREAEDTGRVRLLRFWARRARRLLPAAYVVLLTSAAATFIWLPQIRWEQTFREILGSAVYVQNWVLAGDAVDYLAADNAPTVAQHYWSLSVEEQFYLVWPVLVLVGAVLATRLGRSRRLAVGVLLGLVTATSFGYSLWLTRDNPAAAYFVTPARAWQFGAGALIAVALLRRGGQVSEGHQAARSAVSWAGIAALGGSGLLYGATTPFPGTAALVPVLGAGAVIAAGAPSGALSPARLMRLRPVQWLGDISYSLYLWHWPPIVVLPLVLGHDLGLVPRVGILVAATALATVTKRYVEDPIRAGRRLGLQRIGVTFGFSVTAAALVAAVCVIGSGIAAETTDRAAAVTQRLSAANPPCFGAAAMDPAEPCDNPALDGQLVPAPAAVSRDFADYDGCWVRNDDAALKDCTFGDATDPKLPHVVVVGDSHARALLPVFVRLAEEGQLTVTAQLKGSCPWSTRPIDGEGDAQLERTCAQWRGHLDDWLEDHADSTDLIVTTALASTQRGTSEQKISGFVDAWRPMAGRGVPIVAVKDNPHRGKNPNDCLVQQTSITAASCAISRDFAFRKFDPLPGAAARVPNADLLDLSDFYCSATTCPAVIGGVNVYRDQNHITNTYALTLAPYVYQMLLDGPLG